LIFQAILVKVSRKAKQKKLQYKNRHLFTISFRRFDVESVLFNANMTFNKVCDDARINP
jgi:hypothetical protein